MSGNGDYISREAALAFQDELAVLLCKDVVTGDVMSATKDADLVKYLLSIPAADVRPVVLCRDCKYSHPLMNNCKKCSYWSAHGLVIADHDFCSHGEKREES